MCWVSGSAISTRLSARSDALPQLVHAEVLEESLALGSVLRVDAVEVEQAGVLNKQLEDPADEGGQEDEDNHQAP